MCSLFLRFLPLLGILAFASGQEQLLMVFGGLPWWSNETVFFVEIPKPKEGPFKKPKFQLKHFFSDETASFGRKTLFRPKYFVSAEFLHQSLNKILAETRVFGWNRQFRTKIVFQNTETKTYFGRNRNETGTFDHYYRPNSKNVTLLSLDGGPPVPECLQNLNLHPKGLWASCQAALGEGKSQINCLQ